MAPFAFVGVDGAIARHNTIDLPSRWVFRVLQESNGPEFVPCRNVELARNLVVYRRADVRSFVNVGAGTAPETFVVEDTYWFAIDAPKAPPPSELGVRHTRAAGGADPGFRDAERGDFNLPEECSARGYGVREEQSARHAPK